MNIFMMMIFIVAYLMGSLSTAILLCKAFGLPDPRTQGSGNPGATNVLRFGGKKLAAMVLVGDALKAAIPVFIAKLIFGIPWVVTTTALCAFLGHIYPVFFNFKGGKGVASYLGGLLGAYWFLFTAAVGSWLIVALITRYSSLSALIMSCVVVLASALTLGIVPTLPLLIMTLLLFSRHRANISRLRSGQEPKIGQK
jgi:glycerol-3-phosphate acyltransferase PlsY